MSRIIEVIRTVLPVLVMLGIGMLCRSRKLISREGINALKSVVVNITLPAVLLSAFATTRYTLMDVAIPLMMFGVCLLAWALGRLGGRLFRLPEVYAATRTLMETLLPRLPHPFAVMAEPYQALMMLRQLGQTGDLALPSVRALGERDRADETLYCLTLYTYLCCHRSLQETCARLFTHRNTVLYRVRKLKEEFDIPVDDPDQHLALLVSSAMMLMELGREDVFMPGEGEASDR